MFDNIKADLNSISSYLWIVIISFIFSIYSLKYNVNYIRFGFITFAYGIIGHTIFRTFDGIKDEEFKIKRIWIRIALEIITLGSWIYFAIKFS